MYSYYKYFIECASQTHIICPFIKTYQKLLPEMGFMHFVLDLITLVV